MKVTKTLSLVDVNLKMEGDAGKFSGYASVFGGFDSYGDTIQKGAFVDAIKSHNPKMFFNHEWTMPIGKWVTVKEDDRGLFVEGELTPGLSIAEDVKSAMKHGTLDGLSIGGFLKKGDYQETSEGRVIHKWSNLVEVSPVVFPADGAARIDLSSVKSIELLGDIEQIETIRELESFMREACGFTKGAAQAFVARVKTAVNQRDADDNVEAKTILAAIERLNRRI
jgi:HK97 family phage prohead protease